MRSERVKIDLTYRVPRFDMGGSLISVVMPAFNSAEHIVEALDSVLRQSYNNFELIVVNDGSTDNTERILAKYEDLIRVIKTVNNGVSVARNIGILESRGDYIAFLDSDDIWHSEKLRIQIEFLEKKKNVSMIANSREKFFDSKDIEINNEISIVEVKTLHHYDILHRNPIHCSSVLVRRQALSRSGLFDSRIKNASEDTELWARMARTETVVLGSGTLSWLRDHKRNTTKTYNYRVNRLDALKIMKNYWSDDAKAISIIKENMRAGSVSFAYEAADRKEFDAAKKYFQIAFFINPVRVKFLFKYFYYLFLGCLQAIRQRL